MVEKKQFRCKSCSKRSWFKPEYRFNVVRGRSVKEIFFKCPKCLCCGWVRFRK